jgi:L-ascorbate metabolism protein UlaG (beta-lactamase superfamily)
MTITYYHHSGFTVASGNTLLIFDYWTGKEKKLPEHLQISVEDLAMYKEIYVFISHVHEDHYDDVVYEWEKYVPVHYVISADLPGGLPGVRMTPGASESFSDRLKVKAAGGVRTAEDMDQMIAAGAERIGTSAGIKLM